MAKPRRSRAPWVVNLDEAKAQYWGRPTKRIHDDPQSPLAWALAAVMTKVKAPSPEQEAELQRAAEALASRSDEERELARDLPTRAVEQWVLAPPEQRERATDWLMGLAVGLRGPAALCRRAVQARLAVLWRTMHAAPTLAERTAAKDRWRYITSAGLPNLRHFKDSKPIDGAAVADHVAEAFSRIAPLRKRRWHAEDPAKLTRKLRAKFPGWPAGILKKLAAGIIDGDSDTVRAMIHAGVGRPFARKHTGVRDALAAKRRPAKVQRRQKDWIARNAAGQRRYRQWLRREGLKPNPSLLAELEDPPTIS